MVRGNSLVLQSAQQELTRGLSQILGRRMTPQSEAENSFVLGTLTDLRGVLPQLHPPKKIKTDGFWIKSLHIQGSETVVISGRNDRGVPLHSSSAASRKGILRIPTLDSWR
jgi:alpha-glucuronidase